MASVACESGGGFAEVAEVVRVGSVGEEQLGEVAAVGGGRGEERGVAAGLGGVGIGSGREEELNRLRIAAEGERGVQGLIALRILGNG